VTTIAGNQLSGSEFKSAINSFGRKPLAGDLVVVYFAADGEAASLKVGDGAMTLDDAVGEIVRSLATENVVFLEDVNWSGSGSEPVDERLSNLPRQWAYVTPNSEGGARAAQGGTSLLAGIVADVFRGEPGDKQQLTLERFVDLVLVRLERSGKGSPDKYGYYSPNITMAERE
jgi:hypothetical protein